MEPVGIGDMAPDVELRDSQGDVVRLSAVWQQRPAIVFFLRHLGCPCTGQQLETIRRHLEKFHQAGAAVVIVTLGLPQKATSLFEGPERPDWVLIDPNQQAYRAYGLGRGGVWQLAGPQVWWTAFKAMLQGRVGRPIGDVRQLAGTFLVDRQGQLRYVHRARHSADFPDHEAILARLAELAGSKSQQTTP
ncbi:MAG: AhpC/TSA family protein [Thermoguttaceae bacterium]|nr:AhpC/TSA family protein [Thermoguttaceae bacterium]MDW8038850.1 peroxiredoxin-like family protein [Thermoguttaceae bacterium]